MKKNYFDPLFAEEISLPFMKMMNGEPMQVIYRRYLPDCQTMKDCILGTFQEDGAVNERVGKGHRYLEEGEHDQSTCFLYGFPHSIDKVKTEYVVYFKIFGAKMKTECVNLKSIISGEMQFIRNAKQLPPSLAEIFQKFKG